MPDGLYRPYFHGELVAEYRKSVASRKPSVNGLEAQNYINEIEEYVEPGTHARNFRLYTTDSTDERLDLTGYRITFIKLLVKSLCLVDARF